MSEIVEILGEKKFANSRNQELSTRIVLDDVKKVQNENNYFFNISQQDQYISEKNSSNNFRIYGKINPIINLEVYNKTINGDVLVELNRDIFDFNLENWSIVILKSKRIESFVNESGVQQYSKGVKNINTRSLRVNIERGLPAQTFESKIYTENHGLYFPLGHNFIEGDRIRITSNLRYGISSGYYEVVFVDGDKIFIDIPPRKNSYIKLNGLFTTRDAFSSFNDLTLDGSIFDTPIKLPTNLIPTQFTISDVVNLKNIKTIDNFENVLTQKINGLTFEKKNVPKILNEKRPELNTIIKPEYNVAKIVEGELFEYYIKTLEVIDIIEDLDLSAFSINALNNNIYNFLLNHDLDISNLFNNLNEPISDLYIGIIKNGSPDLTTFSSVESHFSKLINYININQGVERITNNNVRLNKKVNIGDVFYYGLCEYTTENLNETEIDLISHRFIHRDVLFKYNPFHKIPIKLKSTYIEDSETNENIPNYSIYSRQREKYIWRDIFDIGTTDEDGNNIDFPFTNNAFYTYSDLNLFVLPEPRMVRKYNLNTNDITSIGNTYTNEILSILDDLNLVENEIKGIKPYSKYRDRKC
jgi:hypothetical protein